MDTAQNSNEEKRLKALQDLNLLDSQPEERFDRITRLLAKIFSVPAAGVSLVDKDRVWFKSIVGIQEQQIPRDKSFENHIIESEDMWVVNDATSEEFLKENVLVREGPQIKFYAGVALKNKGQKIGVLFIADRVPREFSEDSQNILKDIASWVELELIRDQLSSQSVLSKQREELTKMNRELAESKAKDEAMLENIGDGIIGINSKGEITYVNVQAEKMLGVSEVDLLNKIFIHSVRLVDEQGKSLPLDKRPIRNALLSKKRVVSREYFYVKSDSAKFAVAITATPVVLFGQVIGGVNVFRDITREYEIDKMKTEFISLASHQLRTPLSAMKWFLEILLDQKIGPLNKEQAEIVNNVAKSNERMIELVNTLLNISRIESGRIIIEPQPTDLKALVDEVVRELQPKIEKKKHNLVVSVHENMPKVNVDPKLVRHVYMNLLTNAIKYTQEQGDITVMISKSGNEIVSQVSDNGYGIPQNQQEKVFQKFFRAKNITKEVTDGTGLGLYLTKAVVDSSGGKIWFESEEGKGTTFWFILPLKGSQPKKGEVSLDS